MEVSRTGEAEEGRGRREGKGGDAIRGNPTPGLIPTASSLHFSLFGAFLELIDMGRGWGQVNMAEVKESRWSFQVGTQEGNPALNFTV